MKKKYQVSFIVVVIMLFSLVIFYQNCSKKGSLDLGSGGGGGGGGGGGQTAAELCAGVVGFQLITTDIQLRTLYICNGGASMRACVSGSGNECFSTYANSDLPNTTCSRSGGGWAQLGDLGIGCPHPFEQFDGNNWTITNVGCYNGADITNIAGFNPTFYGFKVTTGNANSIPHASFQYSSAVVPVVGCL
jgi:hypothetical protein